MRRAVIALLLSAPFVIADDPEPPGAKAPVVREIVLWKEGSPTRRSRPLMATTVTTEKELAKAIGPDEARFDAIVKKVNFRKEYLLILEWNGPGRDRLTFSVNKARGEVTFTLLPGDELGELRSHTRLFALPRGAKSKVAR